MNLNTEELLLIIAEQAIEIMKLKHEIVLTRKEESNVRMLFPSHYTIQEGAPWKRCPAGTVFNKAFLDKKDTLYIDENPGEPHSIRYKVHSLLFQDFNNSEHVSPSDCPRWDCINGWTKRI